MSKLFLNILCLLIFYAGSVSASQCFYVGGDSLYTKTNFTQGYGSDLFSNNATTQINFFLGYYITTLLGFEIGYQQNVNKISYAYIAANSDEFGIENFTGLASNSYNTTKQLRGFNLNYVPQLQLTRSFSVIAVLGGNFASTKNVIELATFDGSAATSQEQTNYYAKFKQTKLIPRLGFRLQYLITKYFGLRASYIWENTARLQPTAIRQINPTQRLQAKLADTSEVGVGLLFTI